MNGETTGREELEPCLGRETRQEGSPDFLVPDGSPNFLVPVA
jgi:hypothetical protein